MTTSGLTSFNLQFTEIAEEAFERCGVEIRTGYDLRTARRSLNLMTIEWANRGINLWTIEQGEIALTTGQTTFALPTDTIDLLDHVVRQNNGSQSNQIDISITRISETGYATIPNKLTQGRPIQVWINRQTGESNATAVTLAENLSSTDTTITLSTTVGLASTGFIQIDSELIFYGNTDGNNLVLCARGQNYTTATSHTIAAPITVVNQPSITVWPTANSGGGYTFVYWRMRRIQDVGGGVRTQDIPFRLLPCLVSGLAYHMSMKLPQVSPDRIQMLKIAYEEQWLMASTEDREKANLRLAPRQMFW
jgi:hypothetical protein